MENREIKATVTVKFPSGETASELLHYMGADDSQTMDQKPLINQQLADKCKPGKKMELTMEELHQLIKEVDNTLDIKGDHLGYGWNNLQHHNLGKYLEKLKSLTV